MKLQDFWDFSVCDTWNFQPLGAAWSDLASSRKHVGILHFIGIMNSIAQTAIVFFGCSCSCCGWEHVLKHVTRRSSSIWSLYSHKEDEVPSAIRSGEFQGKTSSICSAGLSIDQVIHYAFFYSQHSARIEKNAANYMRLFEVFGRISQDSLQNWGHDHCYNLLPNVSIPIAPFKNSHSLGKEGYWIEYLSDGGSVWASFWKKLGHSMTFNSILLHQNTTSNLLSP